MFFFFYKATACPITLAQLAFISCMSQLEIEINNNIILQHFLLQAVFGDKLSHFFPVYNYSEVNQFVS